MYIFYSDEPVSFCKTDDVTFVTVVRVNKNSTELEGERK